jgi:hypothetical protein
MSVREKPRNRAFQKLVRERSRRTGESYQLAWRRLSEESVSTEREASAEAREVPLPGMSAKEASMPGMSAKGIRALERLFVRPVERFLERAAADVPPKTSMRRMERELDRAGDELSADDVRGLFAELLTAMRNAEEIVPIAIPPPTSPIEASLFLLFDSLEHVLPHGTMALITCGVGIGRPHRAEICYETIRLAAAVEAARGELRALRLKELAWHVMEYCYGPFLHALLQTTWARDGKGFRPFRSIGNVVNEVKQKALLGTDLWIEAAHIRNAASHRGGWTVDIDKGSVRLHDERPDGSNPWTQEFAIDDLYKRVIEAFAHSQLLETVLGRAFKRDLLRPMQPAFVEFAKSGNESALEPVGKFFAETFQQTWESMLRRGWTQAA